jgi:hypothetical protein
MLQILRTRLQGLHAVGNRVPGAPFPSSSQDIFKTFRASNVGGGCLRETVWATAEESFGGRVLSHSEESHCHSHPLEGAALGWGSPSGT